MDQTRNPTPWMPGLGHFDGLVQDCSNVIVNALKPSICLLNVMKPISIFLFLCVSFDPTWDLYLAHILVNPGFGYQEMQSPWWENRPFWYGKRSHRVDTEQHSSVRTSGHVSFALRILSPKMKQIWVYVLNNEDSSISLLPNITCSYMLPFIGVCSFLCFYYIIRFIMAVFLCL